MIKNRLILASTVLVSFLLGCVLTYIFMTKQQMDQILNAQNLQANTPVLDNKPKTPPLLTDENSVSNIESHPKSQVINDESDAFGINKQTTLHDFNEQKAKAIVDDMPDYVLSQYIDKFMTKDASALITDKRRFANRAIEELYNQNDTQKLIGDIKLSLSAQMPNQSMDTNAINKNAKLYAHLDTYGKVPTGAQVFIKWVNTTTGQVLLFEKKDINGSSNQNWVSMKPYDGWQVGSYDIRYYQLNSELTPIAQYSYYIDKVTDDTIIKSETALSQ